jgi:hypothetical protein
VCTASGEFYGDDNVDPAITLRWWRRYPRAVFAAYSTGERDLNALSAYFSLWPVSKQAFNHLRAGRMAETDLPAASIRKFGDGKPRPSDSRRTKLSMPPVDRGSKVIELRDFYGWSNSLRHLTRSNSSIILET